MATNCDEEECYQTFARVFVVSWQLSSKLEEVKERLKHRGYELSQHEIRVYAALLREQGVKLKEEFRSVVSQLMLEVARLKKLPRIK